MDRGEKRTFCPEPGILHGAPEGPRKKKKKKKGKRKKEKFAPGPLFLSGVRKREMKL